MNYQTTDTYLAGYLMASGCPLKAHTRDGSSTQFILEQTDKLQQLVEDYFNMNANVNPLHYGSALKILKNIIYQKDNNYNYDNKRMFNQQRKIN
jgi:hypothetical protein